MGLHYTPPSLRKLQSRDLPTHGHFPAPLHDYHNHPELVILHPTPITTAFITKISLPTVPCADSLFAGTGYLTSPTADQSEFYPSNTFFMSHTNDFHNDNSHNHNDEDSSNTHYNSTLSKKRSPEFAFLTSSGDTPPSSRPPSRSHTQKRPRHKRLTERPRYVTEKDASIQLQHSATSVDVMWPGGTEMERGLLGDFLFGGRNGPRGENQGRRRGFSVLCFLGCTIEHLQTLRYANAFVRTTFLGIQC